MASHRGLGVCLGSEHVRASRICLSILVEDMADPFQPASFANAKRDVPILSRDGGAWGVEEETVSEARRFWRRHGITKMESQSQRRRHLATVAILEPLNRLPRPSPWLWKMMARSIQVRGRKLVAHRGLVSRGRRNDKTQQKGTYLFNSR